MNTETKLWYKKSAEDSGSALPCGNGRIGAMVYGRPVNELISLNEDSVWSGGLRHRNNPDAFSALDEIRKLIDEGSLKKAENLAFRKMQGICSDSRGYMPLGNLFIHMIPGGKAREYRRELDTETATITTEYTTDNVKYTRQVFISYPDDVIVIHFNADKPGNISFTANIDGREGLYDDNRPCDINTITYTGGSGGENGINFAAFMTAVSKGGKVGTVGSKILVENADEATLLITAGSSFYSKDYKEKAKKELNFASVCTYSELLYRHINDYQLLYNKVRFELEPEEDKSNFTTSERLQLLHGNGYDDKECIRNIFDPGLVTLFFNYARYLMISSSRKGSQPMNLQGIWNEDMRPKWGSRYTINVNTQMSYWIAEECNLSECHYPLFDLIERIRKVGSITAQEMYHSRGFVCHHNTDIWGDSAPQDMCSSSTIWPMGAAWLCLHIFEHYKFTLDKEFLKEKYQTLKEAALFFVDYLTEDPSGYLVTSPSVSPENSYKSQKGEVGSICKGAAMDSEIITALFRDVIESSEILDTDKEFSDKLKKIIKKLPPIQIGKFGQIQEWVNDYEEVNVGHRHVSQLFALYPENQISQTKTPKLAGAARATLIRRIIYEDGHFGWSYAWSANMWARLFDGQMAYESLQKLFLFSLSPNMLGNDPPLQIDANMGAAAGIVEMLLQSQDGFIYLLPALPQNWHDGRIVGLRARGNFEISIEWHGNKLTSATLKSLSGGICKLKSNVQISVYCGNVAANSTVDNGIVCFETECGEIYNIKA